MLIDIVPNIELNFKRLESYTEVPPTAEMTNVMVKITTEVLSIVAFATKEIKQGRSSELINIYNLPFLTSSERYIIKLIRARTRDALRNLDRLTMEVVQMAIASVETPKVTK